MRVACDVISVGAACTGLISICHLSNVVGRSRRYSGRVEPGDLGTTLTHEHLADRPFKCCTTSPASRGVAHGTCSTRSSDHRKRWGTFAITMQPTTNNSRLLRSSLRRSTRLISYKQYGGVSLVDATSIGIARDPWTLARMLASHWCQHSYGRQRSTWTWPILDYSSASAVMRSWREQIGSATSFSVEGVDGTWPSGLASNW